MTIPLAGFAFRVSHTTAVPSREHEANILLLSCGCAHTQDTWCRCAGRYVCSEVSDSAFQTLMLQIRNYMSSSLYTSTLYITQWQITDKTKEKTLRSCAAQWHFGRWQTAYTMVVRIFRKLQINWLWKKITCQTKSLIRMKPPCSGKGSLKGLSSVSRPSQCQVSRCV